MRRLDPVDMLPREKCLQALAELRHTKWFTAQAVCYVPYTYPTVYSVISLCTFLIRRCLLPASHALFFL